MNPPAFVCARRTIIWIVASQAAFGTVLAFSVHVTRARHHFLKAARDNEREFDILSIFILFLRGDHPHGNLRSPDKGFFNDEVC